jgi:AcrR family transcriptional regulator
MQPEAKRWMSKPVPQREQVREAFLDAAERLLVELGYAKISTRRLAEEAGANHGLVHYYFGSMEELFTQVLERFTGRLVQRQRDMYAQDVPFIEKWRAAMGFLEQDLAAGYPKVWLELQAMAWNRPDMRERVARVAREWRSVLLEAFGAAMAEYRLPAKDFSVDSWVTLISTFNQGIFLERMSGVSEGHARLLQEVDRFLSGLDRAARKEQA